MENRTPLQKFASLAWYDAVIEFLFRFVAKTSEPLLAAGIVYSAADVLSKGHLGGDNLMLNNAWAISQALCIESSGGVVLVYGIESIGQKDKVKACLYLGLSILLALVGGIMLFMQLAGWTEQDDSSFMFILFALRCIVSVGYIYLCRTKHIRFSSIADKKDEQTSLPAEPAITVEEIRAIVAETVTSVVTNVTIQVEQPKDGQKLVRASGQRVNEQTGDELQLPEHASSVERLEYVQTKELVHDEPIKRTRTTGKLLDLHDQETNSNFVRVKQFIEAHPKAKVREVAAALSMSPSTANKWMIKARSEESKN